MNCEQDFIKRKIQSMNLMEKIGQMIMIDYRNIKEMSVDFEKLLTDCKPGGFILFRSNVSNFEQTKKFIYDISAVGKIPMVVATDQEGGRVQRLGKQVGFDAIAPMYEVGQTNDVDFAFAIGKKIGAELNSLGINMNMAPVLDIYSNSNNKIIANRAFGNDYKTVAKMALSFAEGLKSEQIIPIGKHFPGHGDTLKDSHIEMPIINKNLEELRQMELIPFVEAINKELPGLMVAHIAVPAITQDTIPASLSPFMINNLLRKDMGFNGLVMPDSLKMKAVTKKFTNPNIYLRCIASGNDFVLMPQDVNEAFNTIYQAVNSGVISEYRINVSVERILKTKLNFGLFNKDYAEFCENQKKLVKRK